MSHLKHPTCLPILAVLLTGLWLAPTMLSAQDGKKSLDIKRQEAYELAWDQHYEEAIELFRDILNENPDDLDARLGLSYTYAWNKSFYHANKNFGLVLKEDPNNTEALKGMAYTALWSGKYNKALLGFKRLPEKLQKHEEIAQARGFAYVNLGKLGIARRELVKVNSIKRKQELNLAIQSAQAQWEAWIWGGLSRIDVQNRIGVRAAQIMYSPDVNKRFWLRMDNSLTLDNSSLTLRDTAATAYWMGGNWNYGSKWQSQIEIGRRQLLNNRVQNLIQFEQVYFFQPGKSVKVGSFYGFGNALNNDLLFYTGLSQEIFPKIWTEQQLYLAWVGKRFDQYRAALSFKYRSDIGMEYIVGIQAGEQFVPEESSDTGVWGPWAQVQIPILNRHWVFINARQEKTPTLNFYTLALGEDLDWNNSARISLSYVQLLSNEG